MREGFMHLAAPRFLPRSVSIALLSAMLAAGALGGSAAGSGRIPIDTLLHGRSHAVCPGPRSEGVAYCTARVLPNASSSPVGLSPATMKSVYSFSTSNTAAAGRTIAIVDAYDLPTAETDLNTFSSTFGLPACTSASGCFKKVDQTGGSSYPHCNAGRHRAIPHHIQWA